VIIRFNNIDDKAGNCYVINDNGVLADQELDGPLYQNLAFDRENGHFEGV